MGLGDPGGEDSGYRFGDDGGEESTGPNGGDEDGDEGNEALNDRDGEGGMMIDEEGGFESPRRRCRWSKWSKAKVAAKR